MLFRVGEFQVTSFGVFVALGALLGLWLFSREVKRARLPDDTLDVAVAGVVGGLIGAKGLWVLEHLPEAAVLDLALTRGGMSWFGGLAGGVAAGLWVMHRKRLAFVPVLAAAAPALAIGHAVGRIGCLLVGDDYGRPTDLPWGIAFPQGLPPTDVPVHPTQTYEALALIPVAVLLWRWRRQGRPDAFVLGWYLVLAGGVRFAIESLRINRRVLGSLSVAHLAALAAATVGTGLLVHGWHPLNRAGARS